LRKKKLKPEDIRLYYFSLDPNGNTLVKKVEITDDGSLIPDLSSDFLDLSTKLKKDLIDARKSVN
jgi:hypothetical protein